LIFRFPLYQWGIKGSVFEKAVSIKLSPFSRQFLEIKYEHLLDFDVVIYSHQKAISSKHDTYNNYLLLS